MDSDTARTLGLAALAVLALAAAAATVDTAVTDAGGGFGAGSAGSAGPGVAPVTNATATSNGGGALAVELPFAPLCVPWLARPPTGLLLLGAVVAANALAVRWTGSVMVPAAFTVALGVPAFIVYVLLTACGVPPATPEPPSDTGEFRLPVPSGGGGLGSGAGSGTPVTGLFALLLVAAVCGAALLLFVSTDDDDEASESASDADAPDAADVDAVGRAAGAAADRIEADADVENEVFRAWREMTDELDVATPRSSTPAEFAAAAVDAGMDADDVGELTSLFEAVRYGGAAPTEERERRAVEALRRIEAAYTDDGGGAGTRFDVDADTSPDGDAPAGDPREGGP